MEELKPSRKPNDLLLKCLSRISFPDDHSLAVCSDNYV